VKKFGLEGIQDWALSDCPHLQIQHTRIATAEEANRTRKEKVNLFRNKQRVAAAARSNTCASSSFDLAFGFLR
jgi:hypothetical protein